MAQVKVITQMKGTKMFAQKFSKTFVFNVPSALSFDWLFEFHCELTITDTQKAVVDIDEATIGSAQVKMEYSSPRWLRWLKVLSLCQRAALAFADKTNREDNKDDIFTGK